MLTGFDSRNNLLVSVGVMAAPQILDLVAEVRPLDGELSDDTDWTPVPSLRGG